MSQFRFVASDRVLPEADFSGLVRMKVKQIKRMIPVPRGPVPWDELDDDTEVLYAADESAADGLRILPCRNPPYGLGNFIKSPFIYWLEGSFDARCMEQLVRYVRENCGQEAPLEFWSIWFGEGVPDIQTVTVHPDHVCASDLERLISENCHIRITAAG